MDLEWERELAPYVQSKYLIYGSNQRLVNAMHDR